MLPREAGPEGDCFMKTIVRNLTGALLVAAAAFGMGGPQGAAQEIRLSDLRAQQAKEAIYASAPCQRAKESPRGWVIQPYAIDPKTLLQDLNTLMDKSDEVILAGLLDHAAVISPSGQSAVTYYEVKVIRSWKGSHRAGDVLTYGMPIGQVPCEPTSNPSNFSVEPDDFGVTVPGPYVFVLFLRQSKGKETQLIQGLRLAAGEGVQGIFMIQVPAPTQLEPTRECTAVQRWSWQRCDAYLETSESPVMDPYARDPLAKSYAGVPVSDFLRRVQSVASGQRSAEKSSSK